MSMSFAKLEKCKKSRECTSMAEIRRKCTKLKKDGFDRLNLAAEVGRRSEMGRFWILYQNRADSHKSHSAFWPACAAVGWASGLAVIFGEVPEGSSS
eukprot:1742685-Amphidinium_carterae.1